MQKIKIAARKGQAARVSGSNGRGYLVISLRRVLIAPRPRETRSLELGIQAVVRSFD